MGTARVVRLEPVVLPSPGPRRIERYLLQVGPLALEVIDAGCAIVRLEVPDRHGQNANVVLAHRDLADYLGHRREYFGAVVGRVANRIAFGRFALQGKKIRLANNDGPHHLHGGNVGFDRHVWRMSTMEYTRSHARIEFTRRSPDGEEGYPGNLQARVVYEIEAPGTVRLVHEATSDAPTVVNLTNHSYFNLAGAGDVLDHELAIEADRFCEVGPDLIPTGRLVDVAGSPFDFRSPTAIGPRLRSEHSQLRHAGGFDHCFALYAAEAAEPAVRLAATLQHVASGRRLRIETDRPGVQFYSGNFLDGTAIGPSGSAYARHAGLCLETQAFPDAPNQPGFPSIELAAGASCRTETVWRFDVLP